MCTYKNKKWFLVNIFAFSTIFIFAIFNWTPLISLRIIYNIIMCHQLHIYLKNKPRYFVRFPIEIYVWTNSHYLRIYYEFLGHFPRNFIRFCRRKGIRAFAFAAKSPARSENIKYVSTTLTFQPFFCSWNNSNRYNNNNNINKKS